MKFDERLTWATPLAKVVERERLDAEHFMPRYEELKSRLRDGRHAELSEIATVIRRGRQPRYVADGSIFVINSRHVGRHMLNLEEAERTDLDFWTKTPAARCERGDVLLNSTGVGSIGRANAVFDDSRIVVDNHVTIIRVPEEICDPGYLALFLGSRMGTMQTEQWLSGSSGQIELYPASIGRFVVKLPDLEVQKNIGKRVLDAFEARRRAFQLVEDARTEIEAKG